MRLSGNGTVRHGTCDESTDDPIPRFDLVKGDRGGVPVTELQETTNMNCMDLFVWIIRVSVESGLVLLPNSALKVRSTRRVVDVSLAAVPPVALSGYGHTSEEVEVFP